MSDLKKTTPFDKLNLLKINVPWAGGKVSTSTVINTPIDILNFKIVDSKKRPGTKCLYMHIRFNGHKKVLFTGSKFLIEVMKQITQDMLPLEGAIIRKLSHGIYFDGTLDDEIEVEETGYFSNQVLPPPQQNNNPSLF